MGREKEEVESREWGDSGERGERQRVGREMESG